jgi:hypothetical protein
MIVPLPASIPSRYDKNWKRHKGVEFRSSDGSAERNFGAQEALTAIPDSERRADRVGVFDDCFSGQFDVSINNRPCRVFRLLFPRAAFLPRLTSFQDEAHWRPRGGDACARHSLPVSKCVESTSRLMQKRSSSSAARNWDLANPAAKPSSR